MLTTGETVGSKVIVFKEIESSMRCEVNKQKKAKRLICVRKMGVENNSGHLIKREAFSFLP